MLLPADHNSQPIRSSLFKPGYNTWRTTTAHKFSMLIDCAPYYRALYHAMTRAKRSIFVLGWDIDGRIELLRGKEAENRIIPPTLFELIKWKAEENPDLKVYLNRWNYSVFFMKEREAFSGWKWAFGTPDNVHFCSDYNVPFSGCHHQKIIVVDDEIAFCGGMDIALGRWDNRQHHYEVEERVDPGGIFKPFSGFKYMPYHDIATVFTGPLVKDMADLVRWRWERAAGYEATPFDPAPEPNEDLWPEGREVDFHDIEVGISRTIPRSRKEEGVHEIQKAYLAEIGKAEKFIYIENQYLTDPTIARAINQRMKERPALRVLMVSADLPRGFMERSAMWTGRVEFSDTIGNGIERSRFAITHPVTQKGDQQRTYHIHSKIMIVDDKFLHVGSANLNRRSMVFDTECDMTLAAHTDEARERIAAIRETLIEEHTGQTQENIRAMIDNGASAEQLIRYQENSRQHLLPVVSEPYRHATFKKLAIKIGDPNKVYLPMNLPFRQILAGAIVCAVLALAFYQFAWPVIEENITFDDIKSWVEASRGSPVGIFWVMGLYVFAGLIFFPVTVLNLVVAAVFGPVMGFVMAMSGSLASASFTYGIGRVMGSRMKKLIRPLVSKVNKKAQGGGLVAMTMIRFIPIAPFTMVNFTFGLLKFSFVLYLLATAFGMLPGVAIKALLGGAIGKLWEDPDPMVILFVAGSLALWALMIWGTQKLVSRYQKKEAAQDTQSTHNKIHHEHVKVT